jgi:hypothetical protein
MKEVAESLMAEMVRWYQAQRDRPDATPEEKESCNKAVANIRAAFERGIESLEYDPSEGK